MKRKNDKPPNETFEKAKIDLFDALTQVQELTPEMIANKMLDHKECYTHTEIHNPIAITILDISKDFFKDLGISDIIDALRIWLRVNYVAYNRQRAKEMVDIIRGLKETEKPLSWQEALLGKTR